MAESIDTTARELLTCVCDALEAAGRPACACFATVGPPVIGLCCECDTDTTGELTVHFERLYDANSATMQQVPRVHPCKRSTTVADLSIILTRCYPMLDETGQMPDTDTQDDAATRMHADAGDVFSALTCGCNDHHLIIQELAVDAMPEAGCAVLGARVSVEVQVSPTVIVDS